MANNDRGFTNGVPEWETFLMCPVSRECSAYVMTAGNITVNGIDRLIEILELLRLGFPPVEDERIER